MLNTRPFLGLCISLCVFGLAPACSHAPRVPANLVDGTMPEEATAKALLAPSAHIKFAESCQRYETLKAQATMVLNNPYFQHQVGNQFSRQGYEPKLVISEPTGSDCANCMKIRFVYTGEQGLKTVAVLVQQGVLLQTEANPRTIDFTTAPNALKELAERIPDFEGLECEEVSSRNN